MIVDASGANSAVTGAIRQASRMTGADFKYLLATAQVESNLNPNARVATSSASGLFQFIDQTWLGTLKQQGAALGYGVYADAITQLPSGRYAVTDSRMQKAVMNLRFDPAANALMAGAFTRANAESLADQLGRKPTEGELYIAHFLGPGGASRLIHLAESNPNTSAATVFPAAASANSSIFHDRRGRARGAKEVYNNLVGRYDVARSGPAAASANKFASKIETQIAPHVASQLAIKAATQAAIEAATQAVIDVKSKIESIFASSAETRVASAVKTKVANTAEIKVARTVETNVANNVEQPARASVRAAFAPDPVLLASTYSAPVDKSSPLTPNKHVASVFHGLFRTGAESEPVAPLVTALWTTPGYASISEPAMPNRRAPAAPGRNAPAGSTGRVHDFNERFRGGG